MATDSSNWIGDHTQIRDLAAGAVSQSWSFSIARLQLFAGDGDQVCARADKAGLGLDSPQDVKQPFPSGGIVEPRIEIFVDPPWAFNRNQIVEPQARLFDLQPDLLR